MLSNTTLNIQTIYDSADQIRLFLIKNNLWLENSLWKYLIAALVLFFIYRKILKAIRNRPKIIIGSKVPEGLDDIRGKMGTTQPKSKVKSYPWTVIPPDKPDKTKGFASIAGMDSLKEQLKTDVINVIRNPQTYQRYGLSIPNGLLLYGPPGCGKTYFAKRFAEESGYSFIRIQASDIASTYIHGTESKIRQVFDLARQHAPCILYFDEINSMVPHRDRQEDNRPGKSGEVSEFLSQLDNIGESGVFVMASTNLPSSIDPAILRSGRLEQKVFVPPPDKQAREAMFRLYLSDRPAERTIVPSILADLTEGYVAADIKRIVDQASRDAIRNQTRHITMEILVTAIHNLPPSLTQEEIERYSPSKTSGSSSR